MIGSIELCLFCLFLDVLERCEIVSFQLLMPDLWNYLSFL